MTGPTCSDDYINRDEVIAQLNAEFAIVDPCYVDVKRTMGRELAHLSEKILDIQKGDNIPLFRSEQILDEATWLLRYTADWNRLHRRIHELRMSLKARQRTADDQRHLVCGSDGGYGAGTTEFYSKLDSTTDAVQRADVASIAPLVFLKPILEPGRMLAYLHRLLVSDIRGTGKNHRAELGSVESSLLQFFCKPAMRALLLDPILWPGLGADEVALKVQRLDESFSDFIDQSQHPRTGYWGPWYLMDGRLIKMHDLSFTFHVVNFRKGCVDRWPEIIRTTLEIRDLGLSYPYGWKPSDSDSRYSNHHNTDVAKIFQKGFDKVGIDIQVRISAAMLDMTDWCLTQSLTSDLDDFKPVDDIDTIDRYAFGVAFLAIVGYWDDASFWWSPSQPRLSTWPNRRVAAKGLLEAVRRLGSDSSFVDDIEATLAPLAGNEGVGIG